MSKYHNTKTQYRGIVFDSKHEAKRYAELLMLEKAGIISGLERQKEFELIPAQRLLSPVRRSGHWKKTERAVKYLADFVYIQNGKTVVEDLKGVQTPEYIIKRKLMLYVHNIRIMEV